MTYKPSIEGKLIIRCGGPAYNPCGREFIIDSNPGYFEMQINPVGCLHSGWAFIDSKIMCPHCAKVYLDTLSRN